MSGHHEHGGTARAVSFTFAVNLAITIAKWTAFAITRSPSLFGEAAHSSADLLNPLVLWFGHRRSARPPDRRHPLGHGREAFFWSLLAAGMMLVIGSALTAYHGIETLLRGGVPERSPIAFAVMAAALVAESVSLAIVVRRLRARMRARGTDLRGSSDTVLLALLVENGADVLGVVLAFAGYGLYVLTGNPVWDAVFSLLIAAFLAATSIFLMNRSRSLIIGEKAPEAVERRIVEAVRSRPSVADTSAVVSLMRGPDEIWCRVSVRWEARWFEERAARAAFPAALTLDLAREETEAIKASIRDAVPDAAQIDIDAC